MTRTLVGILCLSAAVSVAGDLTNYFQKVGTLTTSAPDASVALTTVGSLVKVSCVQDAYVTTGAPGVSCLQDDGGISCDLIRYSLGEKYVVLPLSGHTRVTAMMSDGGVQSCGVFESRNGSVK